VAAVSKFSPPQGPAPLTIFRKPLLAAVLGQKSVTSVQVREINFKPSQETGRHKHPCPVLGYIADGTAVFQIEGEPKQVLRAGSAFYEPADTIIVRFDNASSTADLKFIAYYLLDGEQELIHMLPVK
jgi:quercetin dioxygenase-like cupin family protein